MTSDLEKTQEFRPEPPTAEKIETGPFDVDIAQLTEMLNQGIYTVMGEDGHVRTNLKVRRIDKVVDDKDAITWMVSLYDSHSPKSALGMITMTLGEFVKQSERTIIER